MNKINLRTAERNRRRRAHVNYSIHKPDCACMECDYARENKFHAIMSHHLAAWDYSHVVRANRIN